MRLEIERHAAAFAFVAAGFVRNACPAQEQSSAPTHLPVLWEVVEIDRDVGIGYGVACADVDGDRAIDVILVDRDQIRWYRNPDWVKHVVTGKLSELDHVCIAARDVDGDGKAELAAGATWNPADTLGSGSVHWLVPGADRTEPWQAQALVHEPTTHRMRWIDLGGRRHGLAVLPLHGRGNQDGAGVGVEFLLYEQPEEPGQPWRTSSIASADFGLHQTHNLDPVQWDADETQEILVASREGITLFDRVEKDWRSERLVDGERNPGFAGASEIRCGKLANGKRFLATIEPFHGSSLVVYLPGEPATTWQRHVLDASFAQGHAIGVGDFLARGSDQIIAGWRNRNNEQKVGVKCYAPADGEGLRWISDWVDDGMACEDLCTADLDRDGRLDVVAAGRDSHNLRLYFNRDSKH